MPGNQLFSKTSLRYILYVKKQLSKNKNITDTQKNSSNETIIVSAVAKMNTTIRKSDNDCKRIPTPSLRDGNSCCVSKCPSKTRKDITVKFHCFPKPNADFVKVKNESGCSEIICRRELWKQRLMVEDVMDDTRVCSLHFKKSDYQLPVRTLKGYLKRDFAPTCNLPIPKGIDLSQGTAKIRTYGRKNIAKELTRKETLLQGYKTVETKTLEEKIDLQSMSNGASSYKNESEPTAASLLTEKMGDDELVIKEELPNFEIKNEPPDVEENKMYPHKNWESRIDEEKICIDDFSIKEEAIDAEIKFESVDLPDTDLHDNLEKNWEVISRQETVCQTLQTFEDKESLIMCQERVGQLLETLDNKKPLKRIQDTADSQSSNTLVDKASQTRDNMEEPKFTYIIKSEKHLNVLTGIPSFDVLYTIVDIAKIVAPRLSRVTGLRLTVADRVIMTFMKLKQALSYDVLSFFFKCPSAKSCKRVVLQMLDTLSSCLQSTVRWVSTDPGKKTIVESFRELSNVRCILSRIEIAISRPKDPSRRIATRSLYKRQYSVKFLTAVTPGGWICFLSKPHGGQTSHRNLFENSDIVQLLKKNDTLMILKDFPIDDICEENEIRLIKSLFVHHKREISNPQHYRNLLNVNRTLRRFRIFRHKLSPSLSLRTEQIVSVLCALTNLRLLQI